jgi:hypothetical protein
VSHDDGLLEFQQPVRRALLLPLARAPMMASCLQIIRVTIRAEGPVRVIRFTDDDVDDDPAHGSDEDMLHELQRIQRELHRIDTQLARYQDEKGILINILLDPEDSSGGLGVADSWLGVRSRTVSIGKLALTPGTGSGPVSLPGEDTTGMSLSRDQELVVGEKGKSEGAFMSRILGSALKRVSAQRGAATIKATEAGACTSIEGELCLAGTAQCTMLQSTGLTSHHDMNTSGKAGETYLQENSNNGLPVVPRARARAMWPSSLQPAVGTTSSHLDKSQCLATSQSGSKRGRLSAPVFLGLPPAMMPGGAPTSLEAPPDLNPVDTLLNGTILLDASPTYGADPAHKPPNCLTLEGSGGTQAAPEGAHHSIGTSPTLRCRVRMPTPQDGLPSEVGNLYSLPTPFGVYDSGTWSAVYRPVSFGESSTGESAAGSAPDSRATCSPRSSAEVPPQGLPSVPLQALESASMLEHLGGACRHAVVRPLGEARSSSGSSEPTLGHTLMTATLAASTTLQCFPDNVSGELHIVRPKPPARGSGGVPEPLHKVSTSIGSAALTAPPGAVQHEKHVAFSAAAKRLSSFVTGSFGRHMLSAREATLPTALEEDGCSSKSSLHTNSVTVRFGASIYVSGSLHIAADGRDHCQHQWCW